MCCKSQLRSFSQLPSPLFLQAPMEQKKDQATISAKPQIKNPIGDVTRFMPTSLKVKRSAKDTKVKKTGRLILFIIQLFFCGYYCNNYMGIRSTVLDKKFFV